jgi:nitrate/nitrite transporter NarK
MVIDNVDEIALSLGESPSTFFITLISLANGLGRVVGGYLSDQLSSVFSKLQMLAGVALIMSFVMLAFATGSVSLLFGCLLAVGFLFGSAVSLMAVNVADIFGSRYVAMNFGLIDSAPILGSYIFVTGVVMLTYKDNYTDDAGGSSCVGSQCFRAAFIINAFFCTLSALLGFGLHAFTDVRVGEKLAPI